MVHQIGGVGARGGPSLMPVFYPGIFLVFCIFQLSVAAAADFKELDWSDLTPQDWKREIIMAAPTDDHSIVVDQASLVQALQHAKVKVPGYMVPVEFTGNQVSSLVLVPFLAHHVTIHTHHDPNQMIFVSMKDPLIVTNPFAPLWIKGEMLLESVATDEGPTGYKMTNAVAEIYVY